jgi:flagellar L-ring protein precursor FlgH
MRPLPLLLAATALLAACGGRFDHVGRPPTMTPTGSDVDYRAIVAPERAAIATPPPQPARFTYQQASLFDSGQMALVGDRRARQRGDILTVVIDINESAEFRNTTERSRQGSQSMSVGALFGLDNLIERQLAGDATLDPAISTTSRSQARGSGSARRSERLSLRIAATVVDVLPNGHLVVQGDQQVRVNFELRDIRVTGIVRPEDITRRNEIAYDRMAGARISYGGRGQITDVQQPRIGQQISDIILPF